MLTNYHSHTHFCDGNEAPEKYVLAAIEEGFTSYGFSSHIPLRDVDTSWNMKKENLEVYITEINRLKEAYKDRLDIYCAFETDYLWSIHLRNELLKKYPGVDYTVGSIHYVGNFDDGRPWEIDGTREVFETGLHQLYGGDIKKVIQEYFNLTCEMIANEKPDILGHADKIKMHGFIDESEKGFTNRMFELLELIKEQEIILEINTRGFYKGYTTDWYPAVRWIKEASAMGIKLQVNSDAHTPAELSLGYEPVFRLLHEIGHNHVWIRKGNTWIEQGI